MIQQGHEGCIVCDDRVGFGCEEKMSPSESNTALKHMQYSTFFNTHRQSPVRRNQEEPDETLYWLEVSNEAGFLSRDDTDGLVREGNEPLGIVVSSIRTARRGS